MFIKKPLILLATAMLMVQPVFADDDMDSQDKACVTVVKACLDAGYTRDGAEGKQFWKDCMKPVMLGKTVSGVTVDAKDVKACRTAKIDQLKHELDELKNVK